MDESGAAQSFRYYIGLDVGGTNIKVGVLEYYAGLFRIIHFEAHRTNAPITPDELATRLAKIVKAVIFEFRNKGFTFSSDIGVSFPVSRQEGELISTVNLGSEWINVPFRSLLASELSGFSIFLGNDADLATFCELKQGVLMGTEVGVLFTLGTGIGGGLVFNGSVFCDGFGAPELGHIIVGSEGVMQSCGHVDCLEAYSSGVALVSFVRELLISRRSSLTERGVLTAQVIFEEAKRGDQVAVDSVRRMVEYLSRGIASLVMILNPSVIAIGGGMCNAGDYLLSELRQVIEPKLMNGFHVPEVVFTKEGANSNLIGAAYFARAAGRFE